MVVDHNSTDTTLEHRAAILSRMEVQVTTQPNQGAAAARVPSASDTANPDEL